MCFRAPLERIAEQGVLLGIATVFQNTHPFMAARIKHSADAADNARARLTASLRVMDAKIDGHRFVVGEGRTVVALQFAEFAGVLLDPALANVARWYSAFQERPSAQA